MFLRKIPAILISVLTAFAVLAPVVNASAVTTSYYAICNLRAKAECLTSHGDGQYTIQDKGWSQFRKFNVAVAAFELENSAGHCAYENDYVEMAGTGKGCDGKSWQIWGTAFVKGATGLTNYDYEGMVCVGYLTNGSRVFVPVNPEGGYYEWEIFPVTNGVKSATPINS